MSINNNNQEAAKTREQFKKENNPQPAKVRRRRIRVRILPIWLRIIIVAALIFLSLIAGAAVGYGVIGNGEAKDIFKKSTWTHIVDLIEKE
ncbi:DNA-directed RNA polymerase subunit beta [Cytobacillus praedii]|uniref:DNA-directed RNA polymerase subunit beta n=1 Tax=Cytobacillus praedii TaxID=1742358 RepID=A0A4R1B1D4_9BACI|nr:DNA-directed RNA polymerase subunit beta [Cytobacillus praedii]MED3549386.1 DNA-directed RNA polymerase subunit beta [Cytobacillus praedii]MED3571275.1 DNA-directed RNA polymerase subunit beta [Cytobacillus praedii]TCJ06235.1 DNA-directed RNA polymerase subunit beta [Cytobacillus praedii]